MKLEENIFKVKEVFNIEYSRVWVCTNSNTKGRNSKKHR
jgi:hypothetical protein